MPKSADLAVHHPGTAAYILAARAAKVAAIVEHFDALLVRMGKSPHADAAEMVAALGGFDQLTWFAHAHAAGQRKPSLETQQAVIETYERRGGK